jgi:Ca2+-binding EF-hand superfamily protein
MDLYDCFLEVDRYHHLYIDFDDFVNYIKGDIEHFAELPYAERLFTCMPKSRENRVYFEEFMRGIASFCLLN